MSEQKYVPANVFLRCDKGAAPCQLLIVRPGPDLYDEKWAVEGDAQPVVNIPTFGACAVLQGACMPATVRWQQTLVGALQVDAGGLPQNPLLDTSILPCTVGGKIDIFFTRAAVTQALQAAADERQVEAAKKVSEDAKEKSMWLFGAAILVAVVVVVAIGGAALPLVVGAAAAGAAVGGGVGAVAGGIEGYAHGGTMGAIKGAAGGLVVGAAMGAVGGAAAAAGGPLAVGLLEASGAMFGVATAADAFTFYKQPTQENGLVLLGDLVILFGGRLVEGQARKAGELAEARTAKALETTDGPAKRQCTAAGDPVDVASGAMFFDAVDVELPGPVPFLWERTWYSNSERQGPLGHGWHHSYDLALAVDTDAGIVAMRLDDGRAAVFELPGPANDYRAYYRPRQLELRPLPDGEVGYLVHSIQAGLTYRFTPAGQQPGNYVLASAQNAHGQGLSFTYSAEGHLRQILDSAQRPVEVRTDTAGRILALYLPLPDGSPGTFPAVQYTYDELGNMRSTTDAEGHTMHFAYQGHLIVQKTFRTGMSFYFTYDAHNRCTRTWGDEGYYDCHFTYSPGHTTVYTPEPAATQEYFHERGLVTTHINPLGAAHHWRYTPFDELAVEQDALGHTATYRYDERGNLTEAAYPGGGQLRTQYDTFGRPVLYTDAAQQEWQMGYDEAGQVTTRTDPTGHATSYRYDQAGRLTEVADALGRMMKLDYDAQHNVVRLTTADSQVMTRRYDALGRLVQLADALGNTEQRRYDRMGRLLALRERDGSESAVAYDGDGNVVWAQDAQQTVEFAYTAVDKLAARYQNGQEVRFGYDRQARLTEVRNNLGQHYYYRLNEAGQVLEEQGYDGIVRRYTYDLAGRVTALQLPETAATTYAYNAAGQLAAVAHADGTTLAYAYDANGALTEAHTATTSVRYERDALGRVITETQGQHTLKSAYDARGHRTALTSSLGLVLDLQHDALGNVAAMRTGNWQAQFQHDARGLEVQRTLSNGVRLGWQYDAAERPANQYVRTTAQQWRRRYQWQAADQLTAIEDELAGTVRFTHDAFGALTAAQYPDGSTTLRRTNAPGQLFGTPELNDRTYEKGGQLRQLNGTRYQYDKTGNLRRKTAADGRRWDYRWDASGQLTSVGLPNGYTVTFTYDALGRRVSKHYRGRLTRWLWDGDKILHEWTELTLSAGADAVQDLTTWLFEERSFIPLAKLTARDSYSVVADQLGTPLALYDGRGQLSWQAELDIYGGVRQGRGRPQDCPFRYPGQYEDVETGLYYNRFRYYDPEAGRYISQDPLRLAGGPALYAYIADPLTQTDVLGLSEGSGTLGRNLINSGETHGISNFAKGDFQAHHVIPHEVWTQNQTFFDDVGLGKTGRMNPKDAASNGVFLPENRTVATTHGFDYYHRGSHTNINTNVATQVNQISADYYNSGQTAIDKAQAVKEIRALQQAEKQRLSVRSGGPCGRAN